MNIEVVPYNPNWIKKYNAEKMELLNALGENISEIHHIGSTSVEGLAAKPIIDIILVVNTIEDLDTLSGVFEKLGYEVMGEFGIKGRRYYRKGGNDRTHQIHAFQSGDSNVARHLAFRDYLIAHQDVMKEYANLKLRLASTCNNDIEAYCDGKDSFIKYHEAKALELV